jgi:hypothetical protein
MISILYLCTTPLCTEHIERMDSSRIPNNVLNYRPHGKRSLGRPIKRWSEIVTGHLA